MKGPDSRELLERGVIKGPEASQLVIDVSEAAPKACEEPYGLFPCSTKAVPNLFLVAVYGYLLFVAANFISDGSELLLEVLNPGIIGGLVLPILGAFPDALLVLVSGLGGSPAEAQEQVMVGMGVLAGSTIMILTVAWAGSLYVGRCDLDGPGNTAKDRTLTRTSDLTGTGVTTDEQTRFGAWIMMASTIPFAVVQIPLLDGQPAQGPEASAIGAVISFTGLAAYCAYQVASPWLQQKRIDQARLTFLQTRALQGVSNRASKLFGGGRGGLFRGDGVTPNQQALEKVFAYFDGNKNGLLERKELEGLMLGLGIEYEGDVPPEEEVRTWMEDFDVNQDGKLSKHEFLEGMGRWAKKLASQKASRRWATFSSAARPAQEHEEFWAAKASEAKVTWDLLQTEMGGGEDEEEEGGGEEKLTPGQVYRKAAGLMLAGAAIAGVFADPLVDSIGSFSAASNIPPFFVAFVVTPFASTASELVSSLTFAKKKRKRNISLTYSQVYGAITMNNTVCLGIFLALVHFRALTWNFSSEVTVILLTTFAVGALGGSRTTFPLWTAAPVLALYPLSLGVVAFLDTYLGWT
ncbi:Calcium-binding EF-hand family protein [Klebsormidium nitens]|uniref:Calcium-binding EF-hand family protein n=1 Tax=Klebsormidium nitens TaxID=105231 RepID=A0A1Y1IJF2_KLENI|nr:Calcium-binding EF-hand family protein [Klebsormidium nitens]|eukprot:GAQ88258.1 Calcium-binding EF-hand family protein [Klebsormidium nitens]